MRNALDYLPRKADDDCLQELRWIYDRRDLQQAQRDLSAWVGKWQARYPKRVDWVEANISETLTFYRLPRAHHNHLKSANMLERPNEEIERRTLIVPSSRTPRPVCGSSAPCASRRTRAGPKTSAI